MNYHSETAAGTKQISCVKCVGFLTVVGGVGTKCDACGSGKTAFLKTVSSISTRPAVTDACFQCPAGTYAPSITADCVVCPTGRWSAAGATICTACGPGKTTSGTATAGNHDSKDGDCTVECSSPKIPLDSKAADPSAVKNEALTCQFCPQGKKAKADKSGCEQCDVGTYGTAGTGVCTPCTKGKYQNSKGQTSCTPCANHGPQATIGTGQEQIVANNACTECNPLKAEYSNADGTKCEVCPKGKWLFVDAEQKRQCVACAGDTYNDKVTTDDCGCMACASPKKVSAAKDACAADATKATCAKSVDGKAAKKAECSTGKVYNTSADAVECTATPCAKDDGKCCTVSSSVIVGPLLLLTALYLH